MHASLSSGAKDRLLPFCARKLVYASSEGSGETVCIGVAPITQLRTCVIKIATFIGDHLMW